MPPTPRNGCCCCVGSGGYWSTAEYALTGGQNVYHKQHPMNDTVERCPGTNRDGEPCGHPAGWGTNNDGGPCKFHGGAATEPSGGAPERNQNATTHGLRADPVNLLEDLRKNDEEAFAWIQDKYESYLAVAPFDRDSAHGDQLLQICVREYSIWKASQIQVNDGVLTEQPKIAGERVIKVEAENPAAKTLDRMERTVVKRLEKLGVMPSPEQQQANAEKTLAAVLSEQS